MVRQSTLRLVEAEPSFEHDGSALSHNLNGQKLGRKGRDTRERILAAAMRLLAGADKEAPMSMSAVAREASLGMTSLYNYFADLSELLLAVLEPVMASAEGAYLAPLRQPWSDTELGQRCGEFVSAYHAYWTKHTRLLHLRNAMSDQQDQRMILARIAATQPIIGLLVRQMGGNPDERNGAAHATATVLMIGVERAITISTDDALPVRMAMEIRHDQGHFLRPCARMMELAIRDMRG
ncbi:MAG: hypothetical protein RLY97_258 [Pseudomonadota bacterium]